MVEGKGQNLEWILRCAQTSTIGTLGRVDELDMLPRQPENRANFGTLERVGLRSHNMDLQIIRKSEYHGIIEEFWRLPEGAGRAPDAVPNADERKTNAGLVPDSTRTRHANVRHTIPSPPVEDDDEDEEEKDKHKARKRTAPGDNAAAAEYPDAQSRLAYAYGDPSSSEESEDEEEDFFEEDGEYLPSSYRKGASTPESGGRPGKVVWGANFQLCQPGAFAVVRTSREGQRERSRSVPSFRRERRKKNVLGCAAAMFREADVGALQGARKPAEELDSSHVAAYFSRLNKNKPSSQLRFELCC